MFQFAKFRLPLGAAACVALLCLGCGGGGKVKTTPVAGVVKLDGQPVATGYITFNPADGNGTPAGLPIKNGAFKGQVPPGSKRVLISSTKVVGQRKAYDTADSPMIDISEEQVAPEFNVGSKLKSDIPPEGKSDLSYDVTSAKPAAKK